MTEIPPHFRFLVVVFYKIKCGGSEREFLGRHNEELIRRIRICREISRIDKAYTHMPTEFRLTNILDF